MALIFIRVPTLFTISSLDFHQVKLPWIHCQRWVAPNSPDLSPLDDQVWEQLWSFITGSNRSKKSVPGFKDALQLIWSALSENAIDYCKRLQVCVSASDGYSEHSMWKFTQHMLTMYIQLNFIWCVLFLYEKFVNFI